MSGTWFTSETRLCDAGLNVGSPLPAELGREDVSARPDNLCHSDAEPAVAGADVGQRLARLDAEQRRQPIGFAARVATQSDDDHQDRQRRDQDRPQPEEARPGNGQGRRHGQETSEV